MDAKPQNEMKGLVTWFGELLKTQGGTYAILVWLIFTQQTQLESFQEKIDFCNENHVEFIENQNATMIMAFDKFNETVENFSFYLKNEQN